MTLDSARRVTPCAAWCDTDGPAHHRLHCKFTLAQTHNLNSTIAYSHLENIAGDPNLTIEVIHRELLRVEDALGMLPPLLCIQLELFPWEQEQLCDELFGVALRERYLLDCSLSGTCASTRTSATAQVCFLEVFT